MRVDAAVLAQPRRVAGDVADLGDGRIEGGREQERSRFGDEVTPHRVEARGGAIRRRDVVEDRPGLGVQEDPADAIGRGCRAMRAVVERAAAVPGAVPAVEVDGGDQLRAAAGELARRAPSSAGARPDPRPVRQQAGEELRQPDRLAALLQADRGEAVVPVAGADVRAARAGSCAGRRAERALDVIGERRGVGRRRGTAPRRRGCEMSPVSRM